MAHVSLPVSKKIKFVPKDKTDFSRVLKSRVYGYFKDKGITKHANFAMKFKTFALLSMYLVPYFVIMSQTASLGVMWFCTLLMGIGMAGIGMSIMHDANHGSYSSNPTVNKWLGYTLNLVGDNVFTWKVQHNMLHHTYTNVEGYDEDLEAGIIVRFSPNAEHRKMHRFQHIYAWFLYGLITLSWIFMKDFKKLRKYNKTGLTKMARSTPNREIAILAISKVLYYVYAIVLPLIFLDLTWWQFAIGFVTMHFSAGVIISLVFQLAHIVEEAEFPMPNEKDQVENNWFIHQIQTTANFCRNNPIINWYVGGLNFQIEHHLFPDICHIHYKEISKIVKSTSEEYGIEYNEAPTFMSALKSHMNTLRRLGRNEAWTKGVENKKDLKMAS